MKPGRELDELIAEKIFGWQFTHWEPGVIKWCTDGNQHEKEPDDLPHYSTDIAAAWRVVEKIGPTFSINLVGREWEACFEPRENEEFYGRSESAPHAICLAALASLNPS